MIEMLIENSEKLVQWLWLLMALLGAIKIIAQRDRSDKWALIRESIPEIHDVVQKIARQTPTKKDDEFVKQIGKLLSAAGFKLEAGDVDAVKALGSGFHQAAKVEEEMRRDPLVAGPDGGCDCGGC